MPSITGFSNDVLTALKQLDVRVLREVTDSSDILIESLSCTKCGFSKEFHPPKQSKATAVRDCLWTHRFSWETGEQCGGQIEFLII